MTAYWVSVYEEITDEDKMAAYARLAAPALDGGAVRDIRFVPGVG